jgi:general stress protein YciG
MWREVLRDLPDSQIELVDVAADTVVVKVVFLGMGRASGAAHAPPSTPSRRALTPVASHCVGQSCKRKRGWAAPGGRLNSAGRAAHRGTSAIGALGWPCRRVALPGCPVRHWCPHAHPVCGDESRRPQAARRSGETSSGLLLRPLLLPARREPPLGRAQDHGRETLAEAGEEGGEAVVVRLLGGLDLEVEEPAGQ